LTTAVAQAPLQPPPRLGGPSGDGSTAAGGALLFTFIIGSCCFLAVLALAGVGHCHRRGAAKQKSEKPPAEDTGEAELEANSGKLRILACTDRAAAPSGLPGCLPGQPPCVAGCQTEPHVFLEVLPVHQRPLDLVCCAGAGAEAGEAAFAQELAFLRALVGLLDMPHVEAGIVDLGSSAAACCPLTGSRRALLDALGSRAFESGGEARLAPALRRAGAMLGPGGGPRRKAVVSVVRDLQPPDVAEAELEAEALKGRDVFVVLIHVCSAKGQGAPRALRALASSPLEAFFFHITGDSELLDLTSQVVESIVETAQPVCASVCQEVDELGSMPSMPSCETAVPGSPVTWLSVTPQPSHLGARLPAAVLRAKEAPPGEEDKPHAVGDPAVPLPVPAQDPSPDLPCSQPSPLFELTARTAEGAMQPGTRRTLPAVSAGPPEAPEAELAVTVVPLAEAKAQGGREPAAKACAGPTAEPAAELSPSPPPQSSPASPPAALPTASPAASAAASPGGSPAPETPEGQVQLEPQAEPSAPVTPELPLAPGEPVETTPPPRRQRSPPESVAGSLS